MNADQIRPPVRRARRVKRVDLPTGPMRDLRDAVYRLYLEADSPTLEDLAGQIAADDDFSGMPKKDLVNKILSGREGLASQHDTVSVAVALAQQAGHTNTATLAKRIRDLWVAAQMASPPARLGRPINQYTPLVLEVHRAIEAPGQGDGLPLVPLYVPRAHDAQLRQVIDAAATGTSRMAVLVGDSSTGKTRACWEAIQTLPDRWWLWHPIDPSRPDAAVQELSEVGPYTVVWLNEAQYYLSPPDRALGERICAGLRSLLRDPDRGPVLIVGTIWPHHWDKLTAQPRPNEPETHPQARELLAATDITVPDTFNTTDLQTLQAMADHDPRLRHAAEHAQGGRITQHLAGVPKLLARYRNAPPAARAITNVAIDARRLGHPLPIPYALLEQAAPGYMDDHDWDQAGEDWLEQALAYTAQPCHGVPGLLTRIRLRSGVNSTRQPHYRLSDYLEQTGRSQRAAVFPPADFWNAAACTITNPDILHQLGQQAHLHGHYDRASQLYQCAADRGNNDALASLALVRDRVGDHTAAEALALRAADRGNHFSVQVLAQRREESGDHAAAEALALRAADRGYTQVAWELGRMREDAGNQAGAEAAYRQAADRGDTFAQRDLVALLERAGDHASAEALAMETADRDSLDALVGLAMVREMAGDHAGAERLFRQAADRGDGYARHALVRMRDLGADHADAETIVASAADSGAT